MSEKWIREALALGFTHAYALDPKELHPREDVREMCAVDQCRACGRTVAFTARHRSIFSDEAAVAAFGGFISRYHSLLRSQLAALLRRFCGDEFAAESMLTWTVAGIPFEKLYELVRRLF